MSDRIPDTGQDPQAMITAGYAKVVDAEDAIAAIDRIHAGEDPAHVERTTPHVWIPFESTDKHRARTGTTAGLDEPVEASEQHGRERRDIVWDKHPTRQNPERTPETPRVEGRDVAHTRGRQDEPERTQPYLDEPDGRELPDHDLDRS